MSNDRREFLRLMTAAGGGLALNALPVCIQRALAIPAASVTGTINDVQHVVILMQENRSFDHYFGTLRGVRGFGDRHPIPLPGGAPVWQQSYDAKTTAFKPFHLDTATTSAQCVPDLNHGWSDAQEAANQGRWDRWVPAKVLSFVGPESSPTVTPRPGLTMGHYRRDDIPFQFALADAFTLCDAYHCSIHGSTTPNRIFLMTGTNDPLGVGGGPVIDNSSSLTPASRAQIVGREQLKTWGAPGYGFGPRYTFKTYPERLEAAGVSWRVYQDPQDNMQGTLNALAAFEAFAWAPKDSALWRNGMSRNSLDVLRKDVIDATLPQVSWIVPTAGGSEHPYSSTPIQGAAFTQQVLDALTANPEVWSKTVLFLCFDENDGFFDHMPAPAPPAVEADGSRAGLTTMGTADEIHGPDQRPYGLGPRVPMYVISPWSKGGWVSSEVFDHTSVIRFLEQRFGVMEPNISAWRRAVCGDLTTAFDFKHPSTDPFPELPDVSKARAMLAAQSKLPVPAPPRIAEPLFQESGVRRSRALPYELAVDAQPDGARLALMFRNSGRAGVVFHVYDRMQLTRVPRRYTVGAGKSLRDVWDPGEGGRYDLEVHAPNGFLRAFKGSGSMPQISMRYDLEGQALVLSLSSSAEHAADVSLRANAHSELPGQTDRLEFGAATARQWSVRDTGGWYDLSVLVGACEYRFAGRMETGRHSTSDPAQAGALLTSRTADLDP